MQKACYGNPIIRNPYPELFVPEDIQPNRHSDALWFDQAAFGLFIHWGISAVSGEYDLSWGMLKREPGAIDERRRNDGMFSVVHDTTPAKYWDAARYFDVSNYDPVKWLIAAGQAGLEYAVFTTRHHDGFALWPSDYGDFNTKNYLDGRDLVGEYVEACRTCGLKVGFYYSPPDWYMEREWMNYSLEADKFRDIHHQLTEPQVIPRAEKIRHREYVRNQVEELLTRYGKIDLLWFDCVYGSDAIPVTRLRELQPGIVINNRGRSGGDFLSNDEGRFPQQRHSQPWDYCDVMNANGWWGYLRYEAYRPVGWVLEMLAKTRAWGGKFLINVAPDSQGELPAVYYKRMQELSQWMVENRQSVQAEATPYWPEQCNVPVTGRGDTLYLHVHWCVDYPVQFADINAPKSLTLKGIDLPYQYEKRQLSFTVPAALPGLCTRVVELRLA